ncbi:N-6 DNA methylase [Sphingomonas astaxanthinifaciens]|uniref:DNA methylase adenine-specific domain-containing protein n=1 Tax=Sphingomonas astaxanthinifaciens DSM 22298 TaxID=1123267 RepID=A0ABQ5Z7M6_9SPHN|nr:N-6 DNA methylase [Sphingomonas astaxanthinifaciens]GLR47547.1 hypothetical protein GCM10007925_12590 [Sphingomonas astaxanthinifaciens DSM 22298]
MTKFCNRTNLTNEAAVENLFVTPLIRDLGYADHQIRFKDAIERVEIALGRRLTPYRPDYILNYDAKPRVVVDAKAAHEDLIEWVGQATSYCITLNRQFRNENPARYFLLSNGIRTLLYEWDEGRPLLDLSFDEVRDDHPKYIRLKELLRPSATAEAADQQVQQHRFYRRSIPEVNAVFSWCHQHIYKTDNISQAAGFTEFVKLVFLKLISDRNIRDQFGDLIWQEHFDVPAQDVRFSTQWIQAREEDAPNPIDALQFRQLVEQLEEQISAGTRKRIFEPASQIRLTPETILAVVRRLESTFLFGIDVDLNGRLFETFLSATMRGKDLGQFFTPRSVVKLGTRIAAPTVDLHRVEKVLDGCCGTGGFLIDALAYMWQSIADNPTLSDQEKRQLRHSVANNALVGVDVGKDPNQARLARMNMYLHGDGGTSIYEADFLDKRVRTNPADSAEIRRQAEQFRTMLASDENGIFDVVLTNPPFAKEYKRTNPAQGRTLSDYELSRGRQAVKSNLLFFERYFDVLKPGGRLVSVIDDGLLGGSKYRGFRDYLRSHFLIKAIISLPGDAFQRSQARVKTSLIVLEKRTQRENVPDAQGPVFMFACQYVGIDDPARQRTLPIDRINRERATAEIDEVVGLYSRYSAGQAIPEGFLVRPDQITDRLDVKSCTGVRDRLLPTWQSQNVRTDVLSALIAPVAPAEDDIVELDGVAQEVTYLVVGYDGFAKVGATVNTSDIMTSGTLRRVHASDIAMSNINAVNGSTCVVPPELDGCVVTSEYSVFRTLDGVDPWVLWTILRSPEIRAEFLMRASGVGRTRVDWETIADVVVPVPGEDIAQAVTHELEEANRLFQEANERREAARALAHATYGLGSDEAEATLRKFKPPK